MGRKHYGKRRNCSLRSISPFPTVFSRDLNGRHVKIRLVWERVDDLETRNLLKTLRKEEKMLVTSIVPFSHNVFYPFKSLITSILTSANAFSFVVCKVMSVVLYKLYTFLWRHKTVMSCFESYFAMMY